MKYQLSKNILLIFLREKKSTIQEMVSRANQLYGDSLDDKSIDIIAQYALKEQKIINSFIVKYQALLDEKITALQNAGAKFDVIERSDYSEKLYKEY